MYRLIGWIVLAGWLNCGVAGNNLLFRDTAGHTVNLTPLKNQWIIIHYWAAWCPSCIEEIPELNQFDQHHDKNVLLYGVNYDKLPLPELKHAIIHSHIEFPILTTDPGETLQLEEVAVLPLTFIINPYGQVVKKIEGPNTEASLRETLHALQASA